MGEKANASLLFKSIWCVCWADEPLDGAQSPCCLGFWPPAPRALLPGRGSVAHRATLGDDYFQTARDEALAGPERNRILIKTNSSPQNKGEEPASCSYLDSCFLGSGSVELGVVVRRRSSRLEEKGWRPWVPLWGEFGHGYPRATLPLFTSRCRKPLWNSCLVPGPVGARMKGRWMDGLLAFLAFVVWWGNG